MTRLPHNKPEQGECMHSGPSLGALAAMVAVLLFSFVGSANADAAKAEKEISAPVAVGATGARFPWPGPIVLGAEAEPQQIGTALVVALFLVNGLTGILSVIAFFRPAPALHKQFADREETHDDIAEIKGMVKETNEKLSAWSSDHYAGRRRMYGRINVLENALSFLTGKMARENDPDAKRLEALLARGNMSEGDDV